MPYKAPFFFGHAHIGTIFPVYFRSIKKLEKVRNRITTSDGDFLDLDWYTQGSSKIVILTHGLEGSSDRPYIKAMARIFLENGYDVLAWNCRGCSGELNLTPAFYHSGFTTDLDRVITEALHYQEINLVGFSMGGNITMKYLSEFEQYSQVRRIHRAVAISPPLDLKACSEQLKKASNFVYTHNFLLTLKDKVKKKAALHQNFPVDLKKLTWARNFHHFDNLVTATLFGYKDAEDYWRQNSACNFMHRVQTKSLVISSFNDPLLGDECFPLLNQKYISYDYTKHGGHVGFIQFGKNGFYWSEERTLQFIQG
ncbi:MAG: YheT family hydrolase [Bacteriovoracaceae bacterium]